MKSPFWNDKVPTVVNQILHQIKIIADVVKRDEVAALNLTHQCFYVHIFNQCLPKNLTKQRYRISNWDLAKEKNTGIGVWNSHHQKPFLCLLENKNKHTGDNIFFNFWTKVKHTIVMSFSSILSTLPSYISFSNP